MPTSDSRCVISNSEILGESRRAAIVLGIRLMYFYFRANNDQKVILSSLKGQGNSKENTSGIIILQTCLMFVNVGQGVNSKR